MSVNQKILHACSFSEIHDQDVMEQLSGSEEGRKSRKLSILDVATAITRHSISSSDTLSQSHGGQEAQEVM